MKVYAVRNHTGRLYGKFGPQIQIYNWGKIKLYKLLSSMTQKRNIPMTMIHNP